MSSEFCYCIKCGCKRRFVLNGPELCSICLSSQHNEEHFKEEISKYKNKIKELENKLKELGGNETEMCDYFLVCDQRDKAYMQADEWKLKFNQMEFKYNRLVLQMKNLMEKA